MKQPVRLCINPWPSRISGRVRNALEITLIKIFPQNSRPGMLIALIRHNVQQPHGPTVQENVGRSIHGLYIAQESSKYP